jgi:sulfate transport system ATP-binding protein
VTVEDGIVLYDGQALDVAIDPAGDGPAELYFRPHDAILVDEGAAGALPMLVCQAIRLGGATRIEGKVPGLDRPIDVRLPSRTMPAVGRRVGVHLRRARLFAPLAD